MRAPETLGRLRAIAFDLDGTLVDSAPDIAHALNAALLGAGLQPFDLDTVRAWIGDGPDRLIERALAAQGLADAHEALRQRLRVAFDVVTLDAPLAHGHVYEGIEALLAQLAREQPLVVVTNKPTALARAVLAAARLLPHLCAVHGADTPVLRKPSPAMLQAAADRLGVSTAELLMVGDGPADLRAAEAAGCPAALVSWGYGHEAAGAAQTDTALWRVQTPQHLLAGLIAATQDARQEHPSTFRRQPCLQEADRR
ncbi:HAD-IA family hydrolase [Caldimonas tepidiphila]|uniref:HAD-IA family hydrolase n=1 Tax=Caldimonas tepidiphila TaxID=2315841 RepID=UPI000E5B8EB4|nr:HAD-IA family hydrolase [Caldimonas tepidiphila]